MIRFISKYTLLSDAFANQPAGFSCVIPVCPSVSKKQLGSHVAEIREKLYLNVLLSFVYNFLF